MPGMAYPATVLALATVTSYPRPPDLFGGDGDGDGAEKEHPRTRQGTGGSPGAATKMENRSKLASCTGYPR
jgi:hypothetical protein